MRGLIFSAFFLLIIPAAWAGTDLPIPLESNAEAKISVSSRLRNLPPSGFAPIVVNLNNDSDRAQSWSFQFNSPSEGFGALSSMAFAVTLSVPSKSTRAFNILVPLAFGNAYFGPLSVTVSGPWTNGQSRQHFPSNRSGKPVSAFIAMSETLAAPSWSRLEKDFEDGKKDLTGTRFVPDDLPDDWRGLAGIAGIWLTVDELNFLWPAQRAALREWVYRGGSLFLHGAADLDPQFRTTGFGQISVTPETALDISRTASAIEALKPATLETQLGEQYNRLTWKAVTTLGPIKLNASLLIGFMALFAVVAGPVNLFVFARRTHRHRLFWTTPLISVAATGALLVLIICQDGVGGSGSRVALIYVSPTEKQDVLLQEQITRTGVVLASSFATKDPCYVAPIALDPGYTPKRAYENSGTSFGGEWFVSRAMQAHWLESIAPTRAGIVFANAAGTGDAGARPVIVSNIGGMLEQVHFRDENGRTWRAGNVRTGERVTMESEEQMPDLVPAEAGPRLRTMWSRVSERNGYFYAISRESASLMGTLPSIRWKNDCVIYLGPLLNPGPGS